MLLNWTLQDRMQIFKVALFQVTNTTKAMKGTTYLLPVGVFQLPRMCVVNSVSDFSACTVVFTTYFVCYGYYLTNWIGHSSVRWLF